MKKIFIVLVFMLIFLITQKGYCAAQRPCDDRWENVRDRRENIRDRRENVADRRDDAYKARQLKMLVFQRDEAVKRGHVAKANELNKQIEDLKKQIERDKRENIVDKGENVADRVENVIDRHN